MNSEKMQHAIVYYTRFFISFVIAIAIYGVFAVFVLDVTFWEAISRVWYLPFVVPVVVWVFNRIIKRPDAHSEEKNQEWEFLKNVSNEVRRQLKYDRSDFKELRNDDNFRQFMSDMYEIYRNGETDELQHEKLVQQFQNAPKRYEAAKVVSEETKALREKDDSPRK